MNPKGVALQLFQIANRPTSVSDCQQALGLQKEKESFLTEGGGAGAFMSSSPSWTPEECLSSDDANYWNTALT